jgi:putative cell wall-binding protein
MRGHRLRRCLALPVALVLLTVTATAAAAPVVERVAGEDRYATAARLSQTAFPDGVSVVYVAGGLDFPDALAAGPAAAQRRAPLLLVAPDEVPPATAAELERLSPARILLLGGPASVAISVEVALRRHAPDVVRLAGDTRYDTAAAVSANSFPEGAQTAYVASGVDFADALSGAVAAGVHRAPLLLVEPGAVPHATHEELARLRPGSITVLGGHDAVSAEVEAQLAAYAPSVTRWSGPDRHATAVAVSSATFAPPTRTVFLAAGSSFPDALSAGPVAALSPGPVLLVPPDCVPQAVDAEIERLAPERLVVLGGDDAVGSGVEARQRCPRFEGAVWVIDDATRQRMTSSWRPGCPVPIDDLRLVTATHWGFDGHVRPGELVVHRDHAEAVLGVLASLFDQRFPIERMELVDVYGADDDRSMAANNTSAFNCREVSGRPGVWSEHAYGRAIDVNPVQNPYVSRSGVSPPAAAEYADRSRQAPGMIHAGDGVVGAFAAIGWEWGGSWSTVKDYQHFSATGR